MTSGKIPTPEEFERASRLMKERARGLEQVRQSVLRHFRTRCCLHDFHILDQRDVDFRAYVFFCKDSDVDASRKDGTSEAIVDYVYSELERLGRGRRDEIEVAFELDSDENVSRNFGGDYFMRLR